MTSHGASVARELRSAMIPVEVASIVDHRHLVASCRALLKNALFWVVPTPSIETARARALAAAERLAAKIDEVGVNPHGSSPEVDSARTEALDAYEALIEAVADAEPTQSAKSLGIA